MMKMFDKILIGTAIIGMLSSGLLLKMYSNQKAKSNRIESAYDVLEDDSKSISLKYNELNKRQQDRINTLADSIKIKPKKVIQYVNVNIKDTIIATDTVYIPSTKVDTYIYEYAKDTGCFYIKELINVEQSIPKVAITELQYDNDIEYIVYLKRKQWKLWIIKSRLFGRKEAKLETFSKCGNSTIENINIVKK